MLCHAVLSAQAQAHRTGDTHAHLQKAERGRHEPVYDILSENHTKSLPCIEIPRRASSRPLLTVQLRSVLWSRRCREVKIGAMISVPGSRRKRLDCRGSSFLGSEQFLGVVIFFIFIAAGLQPHVTYIRSLGAIFLCDRAVFLMGFSMMVMVCYSLDEMLEWDVLSPLFVYWVHFRFWIFLFAESRFTLKWERSRVLWQKDF